MFHSYVSLPEGAILSTFSFSRDIRADGMTKHVVLVEEYHVSTIVIYRIKTGPEKYPSEIRHGTMKSRMNIQYYD